MCVGVGVCVDRMNLKYALCWHTHTYQFIPYYASAIHKHTHTRILKPFEDSEPTGLKVDIASRFVSVRCYAHAHIMLQYLNG